MTLIVILFPLFLVVAVLIKAESEGEVIYGRKCVKKDGTYIMYKFRSMYSDANNLEKYLTPEQIEEHKKEIKVENDPRVTKVGRFIRKTSIDELPQLFDVLKGDMSLVGPRPIAVGEEGNFGEGVEKVLSVKPGMTGYWQTHGRSKATYESGERQRLELYYVDNCSIWMDIKILFATVGVVLSKKGAH